MDTEFYQQNRRRLINELKAPLLIIGANDAIQLRGDQATFKQEANFLYLTGLKEAGWMLIVQTEPYREQLIAPQRNEVQQLFEGGLSYDQAAKISGITNIISQQNLRSCLEQFAQKYKQVAYLGAEPYIQDYSFGLNPANQRLARLLKKYFGELSDIRPVLRRQRAIKQPAEIGQLKVATQATIDGFKAVKDLIASGQAQTEYQLEAELSYHFRKAGTDGHAYEPIVASGANACVLHYGKNSQPLAGGDLVLIDAGALQNDYAADVSRTYALTQPTARQLAVHQALELAEQQIIQKIKPGLSLKDYSDFVDLTMQAALGSLDLLKSKADYRRYFPHAISHGLGLDVHESLGGYAEFRPGMSLTVEPGIYIAAEGLGLRIEDDILVTETGSEVLSAALPTSLWYNFRQWWNSNWLSFLLGGY